jgi:L-iditol 2-dehydrogenase
MKAALLTAPYQIELQEVEEPRLSPTDVLIKVRCVGVCGSDVHAYKGTHPFRKPPVILGHEMAGEVADVGKEVTLFKKGGPGERGTSNLLPPMLQLLSGTL